MGERARWIGMPIETFQSLMADDAPHAEIERLRAALDILMPICFDCDRPLTLDDVLAHGGPGEIVQWSHVKCTAEALDSTKSLVLVEDEIERLKEALDFHHRYLLPGYRCQECGFKDGRLPS